MSKKGAPGPALDPREVLLICTRGSILRKRQSSSTWLSETHAHLQVEMLDNRESVWVWERKAAVSRGALMKWWGQLHNTGPSGLN